MLDDITQIQSTIQDIQSRINALSPVPVAPTGSSTVGSSAFAQKLQQAQGTSQPATVVNGISVPAASLGPLPSLPVIPTASDINPLPTASTSDYEGLIQTYAAKNGLDPSLVRAVIQTESGGDPHAVSSAGAMGLMQLMPANVQESGISDPYDPEQNIAAGSAQLGSLVKHYHGNLDLALAAYNAGPGNVSKYNGVPPFPETQNYLRKVYAAMQKG